MQSFGAGSISGGLPRRAGISNGNFRTRGNNFLFARQWVCFFRRSFHFMVSR
jgi:hypothetical protein